MPLPWTLAFLLVLMTVPRSLLGQEFRTDWQTEVRKYAEAQDWTNALRIVEDELARSPQDVNVRAWHARVLTWSGHLEEAKREYSEIARMTPNAPDNWLGLASVYLRMGRLEEALRALDRAIELDPGRADLHSARGRALRAIGDRSQAALEFRKALLIDPASDEARAGMVSLRAEPKHELRIGSDNDLFSFASANHGQWISLVSRWTPRWTTSFAGDFFQRGGTSAGEFVGSVTGRLPRWGAFTAGGATAQDNGVIPKSEAFWEHDYGWKISENGIVRGVEAAYGQHWYWFVSARILILRGGVTVYLPRDWTWSLGLTEARSHFSAAQIGWRPSGTTKLGFPIVARRTRRLSGNMFFAVGTENFGQVDQIGAFSSQTYGGGLRFQLTERQDLSGYGAFQQRTQNRTDTSFGFSYGLHF